MGQSYLWEERAISERWCALKFGDSVHYVGKSGFHQAGPQLMQLNLSGPLCPHLQDGVISPVSQGCVERICEVLS